MQNDGPRFARLYQRYLGKIDEVAIYDGPVSAATFSGRINMVEGIDVADDIGATSNPVDSVAWFETGHFQVAKDGPIQRANQHPRPEFTDLYPCSK